MYISDACVYTRCRSRLCACTICIDHRVPRLGTRGYSRSLRLKDSGAAASPPLAHLAPLALDSILDNRGQYENTRVTLRCALSVRVTSSSLCLEARSMQQAPRRLDT